MTQWQLQEAKAKLSKLVKLAETEGPQEITVHGEAKAAIVSIEDLRKFEGKKESLLEILQRAQIQDGELDFRNDWDDSERPVDL